jgi:diaminohydroxyphosphoribosylaminopyrimidine deaminase/5-amino-6-(5-phosphoribosylamino)uracil reductase
MGAIMSRAIDLAVAHRPHPNPRVGAVVLDPDGVPIGEGAHERPGSPHAEVHALREAGARARDAEMYVTLEPCNHHGRTPPCTEAIIDAGIRKVVVGMLDPDQRVAGSGVDRLRAAGIDVVVGVESDAVVAADPGYFHHRRTGRARVVHKAAITLDGQMAAADGTSQWITGEPARADAHTVRASMDAVLVGVGTLMADDPRLDVRLPGYEGPQPRPVIIAGTRPLPADARIWERDPLVVAPAAVPVPGELVIAEGDRGAVDLEQALVAIGDRGLLDVLVEGGAGISASLWRAGLVDHGIWYIAGKIAGGVGLGVFDQTFATIAEARPVEILSLRRLEPDLRIDWRAASSDSGAAAR